MLPTLGKGPSDIIAIARHDWKFLDWKILRETWEWSHLEVPRLSWLSDTTLACMAHDALGKILRWSLFQLGLDRGLFLVPWRSGHRYTHILTHATLDEDLLLWAKAPLRNDAQWHMGN